MRCLLARKSGWRRATAAAVTRSGITHLVVVAAVVAAAHSLACSYSRAAVVLSSRRRRRPSSAPPTTTMQRRSARQRGARVSSTSDARADRQEESRSASIAQRPRRRRRRPRWRTGASWRVAFDVRRLSASYGDSIRGRVLTTTRTAHARATTRRSMTMKSAMIDACRDDRTGSRAHCSLLVVAFLYSRDRRSRFNTATCDNSRRRSRAHYPAARSQSPSLLPSSSSSLLSAE